MCPGDGVRIALHGPLQGGALAFELLHLVTAGSVFLPKPLQLSFRFRVGDGILVAFILQYTELILMSANTIRQLRMTLPGFSQAL